MSGGAVEGRSRCKENTEVGMRTPGPLCSHGPPAPGPAGVRLSLDIGGDGELGPHQGPAVGPAEAPAVPLPCMELSPPGPSSSNSALNTHEPSFSTRAPDGGFKAVPRLPDSPLLQAKRPQFPLLFSE